MKIKGLQKLTLIDYPNKFAATIFLFGCNFRCGFCHNPELVLKDDEEFFSKREVLDFLKKRIGMLDGVCITGGEPLLTLEEDFLREIKSLGFLIKIDTNGSFPEKLQNLINKKLVDFIAMDLKTSREKYNEVANSQVDLEKIEQSLRMIINSDLNYEFRTTIVENIHSKEDLVLMGKWVNEIVGRKPKILVLQKFKNSGKFIDEKFLKINDTSENFIQELKFAVREFFDEVRIR